MKQFTLNRYGKVATTSAANNQCKATGQNVYQYHVAVTALPALDANGFIIDHIHIHKAMEIAIGNNGSCENMCERAEQHLTYAFKRYGVQWIKCYVAIVPEGGTAMMEYEFNAHDGIDYFNQRYQWEKA